MAELIALARESVADFQSMSQQQRTLWQLENPLNAKLILLAWTLVNAGRQLEVAARGENGRQVA